LTSGHPCRGCEEDQHDRCQGVRMVKEGYFSEKVAITHCYCMSTGHAEIRRKYRSKLPAGIGYKEKNVDKR